MAAQTVEDPFDLAGEEPEDPFDLASTDEAQEEVDVGYIDGGGRYKLPHPTEPDGKWQRYTRCTTFAKTVADNFKIHQWDTRMTLKGAAMAPSLIAETVAVINMHLEPAEEIKAIQPLADRAKDVAAAREPAAHGTAVHSLTEQYDRGLPDLEFPEPWDIDLLAYAAALEKAGLTVRKGYIERIVLNRKFGIAGKFDRVYRMKTPCPICHRRYAIGDLKTGRTLEYGINEISVQLAIYANADLVLDTDTDTWERMPGLCHHRAYVVHLPVTKGQATIWEVDVKAGYYGAWLSEKVRAWRGRGDMASPTWTVEVTRGRRPGKYRTEYVPLTWEDRIDLAPSVGDLQSIRTEARRKRPSQWTPALQDLFDARKMILEEA